MSESEQEKPWTEEQWEAFMKRQDLKAARFGEILETVIDDPNRYEIIQKEMGWDSDDDDGDREHFEIPEPTEEDMEEAKREMEESDRALEEMDAYRKSMLAAEKVDKLLKPFLKQRSDEPDDEIGEAFINPHIACAKISGGHAMGYHDDVLCANIVKNKIALEANKKGQEALRSLAKKGVLQPKTLEPVLKHLDTAAKSIQTRIKDLRSKVWWSS